MAISFIANIILARMLTPEDFGIIGILLVFVNISAVFVDAGFGSALIQKKGTNDIDYSTIFYWNIATSVTLYIALWLIAPQVSNFYQIPSLCKILRVLGLVLIGNALSLIQTTQLKKQLEFKLMSLSYVSATILAFIVTIILAFKNYGVWSLVAFQLIQSFVNAIILWVCLKWKPRLVFSFKAFREMFKFGGYLLTSSLIGTTCKQIQSLFIGKICSTTTLGYYTQAKNLENAPTNVIYSAVGQVVFPLFSSQQENMGNLRNSYLKVIGGVAYITMPIMFLLIIIAQPLFIIIFSDKWLPSVPYFQLLCLAGTFASLTDINIFAITSLGKSKSIFKWSLINNFVTIFLICIGAIFSIFGIITAVIISSFYNFIVYSFLVKKYVGIAILEQIHECLTIFLVCISLTAIMILTNFFLNDLIFIPLIMGLVFSITYLLFMRILKVNSHKYVWELLSRVIKNKIHSTGISTDSQ